MLTIGEYDEEIVTALAYDLAARVRGEDPARDPDHLNFTDEAIFFLVQKHGEEMVKGLNPCLPEGFRMAIIRLADFLSMGTVSLARHLQAGPAKTTQSSSTPA